ncbi:MAG TPA: cytochrome c [Acidobacteriaceae bacterium]|jgi:mono/diheme cytochrome c family protein|nr:cytochrome c [Acidobacteriaceae bacterium]
MRFGWLVLALGMLSLGFGAGVPAPGPPKLPLQAQRSSPQDLEVTGDVPGIPAGASRFVRYSDLAALPQVAYTVKDDTNFGGPVQLSGVPLDELMQALGATSGKLLVAAICVDGYEGHYTAEYRAQHHPFLVLKVEGKEPANWTRDEDGQLLAPYFVSHPSFKPSFSILAHLDEAQLPVGVTKLRFYDQDATLSALKPPASAGLAALQGYRIAMQNCLRCHNAGSIGGSKSPFQWPQMEMIAQGNAAAFGKYIVQPNRVNPEATMPPNPKYDAATVAALTAYFQSEGAKP